MEECKGPPATQAEAPRTGPKNIETFRLTRCSLCKSTERSGISSKVAQPAAPLPASHSSFATLCLEVSCTRMISQCTSSPRTANMSMRDRTNYLDATRTRHCAQLSQQPPLHTDFQSTPMSHPCPPQLQLTTRSGLYPLHQPPISPL